jgi:anaerobic selenocysteine-containing dehydrogenase
MQSVAETRFHTCMLCEAACGLAVDLEGGRVARVRGDRDDPFSRGHICPKAAAIPDVMADPDRVREPLRRSGAAFTPISWKEALAETSGRLAEIQRQHGRDAVAVYVGNPTVHGHEALLGAALFLRAIGTRSRFTAQSVDQLPQSLAAFEMFGHALLLPVPDVDRTAFLLVLGANPLTSNGSLMTAPGIAARLEALRARGGRVVVVDPRRTETAERADRHIPIRPGGDAALLLGLLHVVFAESLARPGRLAAFTDGIDRLEAVARRFPPERVAPRAGIAADAIRDLAREFAGAPSAVCYGRVGVSTQEFGGLASWLVVALNLVTGNLDRPGGAMFATPAADVVALQARLGSPGGFARYRTRVRGLPEFGGELPAAALGEEIDTPGEGRIRALVTFAGNPVLSTPNGGRLERALGQLDFMVSIDLYRNETTRHAHLILPVAFGFERAQYDLALYMLSVRNAARFAPALVDPPPGVWRDWDVLTRLAIAVRQRGGGSRRRRIGIALRAARVLGPQRLLDLLLRLGPHRLSLAALARSPHGVDLGPLEPRLPDRLHTPDRRIRLVPEVFERDLPRLEMLLDEAPPPPGRLVLLGRRTLRSNNSWMHNSARLVKGPPACTLLIHPDDAAARGLASGGEAVVTSRVGAVRVPVLVSDEMAPGLVSLPHGWGHGRPGTALGVASAHAGASVNDLTDDARVDALCGTADFAVDVTVEPAR